MSKMNFGGIFLSHLVLCRYVGYKIISTVERREDYLLIIVLTSIGIVHNG